MELQTCPVTILPFSHDTSVRPHLLTRSVNDMGWLWQEFNLWVFCHHNTHQGPHYWSQELSHTFFWNKIIFASNILNNVTYIFAQKSWDTMVSIWSYGQQVSQSYRTGILNVLQFGSADFSGDNEMLGPHILTPNQASAHFTYAE